MPSILAPLALGLALLSAPAQEVQPPPPAESVAEAPAAGTAPLQAVPSGLPQRAPEPRTMAEFWPVFAVFALAWVGIAGCFLALGGREKRIARALEEGDGGG